ncbi:MAG: hypothetical protein NW201_07325 [Gemmatimonadales bacterium]|nr:hypothetical protein [Gemmatimonadales bacterium]
MTRRLAPLMAFLLAACSAEPKPPTTVAVGDTGGARSARLPDSLALAVPGGAVWFTAGRDARAPSGAPCVERVMEIRRGAQRTAIPLLYTGETPRLVNDSTIEAHIWLHCTPGNLYRVNLRTGFPVHVK